MTNPQSIPIKDRVTESHLFGCLCLGTYILLSFPLIYLTTTNLIHQILESRSYHYILLHALLMYWWYSSSFLSVLNMMNALMNFLWLLTIGGIFLISFVGGGSLFPLSGFFWWIYLCFLLRKKKTNTLSSYNNIVCCCLSRNVSTLWFWCNSLCSNWFSKTLDIIL